MKTKNFRLFSLFYFLLVMLGCKLSEQAISPTPHPPEPTTIPSQETFTAIPSTPTISPTTAKVTHSPTSTAEPSDTPIVFESVSKTEVLYNSELSLSGYLCTPLGLGPFPAVIFNHGGLGDVIGGAPEETCQSLADAGMVGFSPIRRQTVPLDGHTADIQSAIDYVKNLDYVDIDRLGLMGFSRGGMLTFMVAAQRSDLQGAIIMASALPKDGDFSKFVQGINIPILLLVASNDFPADLNKNQNLVEGAQDMEAALKASGKDVQLIIYPPFEPHGHMMFFEIGDYWNDVVAFFKSHLE
ncbi:MAG: dienelactone hydrolase family protein [Anaerolineales bacterium]|nr:dienelactone hydrolase family protein [Chloroflexota bacterium]MBL6981756.1 dienelactone hydrolase family protein [Anaerolineales bacterium]